MDEKTINELDKKNNELCFLQDNAEIKYHSITIYEFFEGETFDDLVKGLDELYININPVDESRLPHKEGGRKLEGGLFRSFRSYLPYISDNKFKNKVLPDRVFHDLGDNINHLELTLHNISPSISILEIKAYLNERMSDEINKVIYNYYDGKREPVVTVNGKYDKIYRPSDVKKNEIRSIKRNIKSELIDFVSTYFRGYFLKLSDTDISVVPSIDFYSMDYPDNEEDIIKWGLKNSAFFRCFDSGISPHSTYGDKHYIFCEESNEEPFNDFMIFANRNLPNRSDMYPDIDSHITESLDDTWHFGLLALIRWLEIKEKIVLTLNSTISKEIGCLAENRLENIFESRKEIAKELFSIDRFKIEYDENMFWKSLTFKQFGEENDLYDNLKANIRMRIEKIDHVINKMNEHSNNIFSLKNIEYSKKMQESVKELTIIIIGFTIIQIILAIKIPEYIAAVLFS